MNKHNHRAKVSEHRCIPILGLGIPNRLDVVVILPNDLLPIVRLVVILLLGLDGDIVEELAEAEPHPVLVVLGPVGVLFLDHQLVLGHQFTHLGLALFRVRQLRSLRDAVHHLPYLPPQRPPLRVGYARRLLLVVAGLGVRVVVAGRSAAQHQLHGLGLVRLRPRAPSEHEPPTLRRPEAWARTRDGEAHGARVGARSAWVGVLLSSEAKRRTGSWQGAAQRHPTACAGL
jgi:hypothetical protein